MKSISDSLPCKTLAILCFVFGFVGKPLSILTIVPNDTPAFVANSMIVSPFSKRSSFTVFMASLPINRIDIQCFCQSALRGKVRFFIFTLLNSGYCGMGNAGLFSKVALTHKGFLSCFFQIHKYIVPHYYKDTNTVLTV